MREEEVLTNLTEEFESFITQVKNYEDKSYDSSVTTDDWLNNHQKITDITFDEYNTLHPGSTQEEYNAYKSELEKEVVAGSQDYLDNADKGFDKIEDSLKKLAHTEAAIVKNMIAEINAMLAFYVARINTLRVKLSNAKEKEDKKRFAEEMRKLETKVYFLKNAKKDARSFADFINKMDNYYALDNHNFNFIAENQQKFDKLTAAMERIKNDVNYINDADLTIEATFNKNTGKYDVKCTCLGIESEKFELTEDELKSSRLQDIIDKFTEEVSKKTGFDRLSLKYGAANLIKDGHSLGTIRADDAVKGINALTANEPTVDKPKQTPAENTPAEPEVEPEQAPTPTEPEPNPVEPTPAEPTPQPPVAEPTPEPVVENPTVATPTSNPVNNGNEKTPQEMTRIISHRKYRKQQNTLSAIHLAGGLATVAAVGLMSVGAPVAVPVAALLGTVGASAAYRAQKQIKLACINHTMRKIAKKFDLTFVANPDLETGEVYFVKEIEGQPPIIIDDTNANTIVKEGTTFTLQDELNYRFKNDIRGLGENYTNEREKTYRNLSKVTAGNLGAAYEIVGGYRKPIIESQVEGLEEAIGRMRTENSEEPSVVPATPQDVVAPTPEQTVAAPAAPANEPVQGPQDVVTTPEQPEQTVAAPEAPAPEQSVTTPEAPAAESMSQDGINIRPFASAEALGQALSGEGFVPTDARTTVETPTPQATQYTDEQIKNMITLYGEENTYENLIATDPALATAETKERISQLAASLQPQEAQATMSL